MNKLKLINYDRFNQLNPKDDGRPPVSCLRPNTCNSTNDVVEQYERKTCKTNRPYIYTYSSNNERLCPHAKEGFVEVVGLLEDEEENGCR